MKIISLEIETSQLETLKDFYTRVMALPMLSEDEQHVRIQAGFSTITFRQASDRPAGPYHFAFNIPHNKVREATDWLRERVAFLYAPGAVTPVVHHARWEAYALYFYDTDFNILELIAHKAAPATAAPFGPEQILGLAEVGLPVSDVPGFSQQLREQLKLNRWKSATEYFEAVGDEEGMFIVVQEQRPWFPTINPAIPLPMQVEVQAAATNSVRHGAFHILPVNPSANAD
jgi:catechol-2,3-dioxygenase